MTDVSRIKVLARIRPFNSAEQARNDEKVVDVLENQSIRVQAFNGFNIDRTFQLDAVLDADSEQQNVFENIIPLLESALEGFNCTVFTCTSRGIIYNALIFL